MPITKSVKKTLRQEKRRAGENQKRRAAYKQAVRFFKNSPSVKSLARAYTEIDRAAKNHLIHSNKASRLKSQLAKMIKEKITPKKTVKTTKKATPKTKTKTA